MSRYGTGPTQAESDVEIYTIDSVQRINGPRSGLPFEAAHFGLWETLSNGMAKYVLRTGILAPEDDDSPALIEGSFSEVAYFIYVMARLLRGAEAGLLGGMCPLLLALDTKLV